MAWVARVSDFGAQRRGGDDHFRLDADVQAPIMERVMARLGIELEEGAVHAELKRLYAAVAKVGMTQGRLTMRLLRGWKLASMLSVFDEDGFRPQGVGRTLIKGGIDGNTVGALIRDGVLDGEGCLDKVEFRVLPCAEGYGARMMGKHRLEPVGLFYDDTEERQAKLFVEYKKTCWNLDVEYATLMEMLVSAMMDREGGVPPKSEDVTLSWGWYRMITKVPGGVDRRLCVDSFGGQLRLGWVDCLGAYAGDCVVASVGIKS